MLTRKAECFPVRGTIRSTCGEPTIEEVFFIVGRRRVICDLMPPEATGDGRYHFSAVYRVGRGAKRMRLGYRMVGSVSDTLFASRFIWAGPENTGPSVTLPKRGRALAPGASVIGPIQYETGLGEAARGTITAVEHVGIACTKIVAPIVLNAPRGTYYRDEELGVQLNRTVNIFHLNGPEMNTIHRHWKNPWRKDQRNAAFWVFELTEIPDSWVVHARGLHEIWTPSTFARDAIQAKLSIPVHVIPTPVTSVFPERVSRAEFGLPDSAFCVLAGFDLNSGRARKNPDAAIAAFKLAHASYRDLHLVLKVSNADKNWRAMRELRESLGGISSVTFVTESMTRHRLTRLQASCDVFLSLHRSEGFGLHLCECMALGRPVIATDWSASRDYLNSSNGVPVPFRLVETGGAMGPESRNCLWAEADVSFAAVELVKLAGDRQRLRRLGEAASATIKRMYSLDSVGAAVARRYEALTGI